MRLLIIILLLFRITHAQEIGQKCNRNKGMCASIADCQPINVNFNDLYNRNQIIFCDRSNSIVCCPGIKHEHQYTHLDNIFSQVCESHFNTAYKHQCEPLAFVVSGIKAEPKEFPQMALLGFRNKRNSISWFCGGTLISDQYIITAAHCVEALDPVNIIRLGELDHNSVTDNASPQDLGVSKYFKHPAYEAKRNDIALLKLQRSVEFSQYIAPACIAYEQDEQYQTFLAAGWGAVGLLKNSSTHLLKVQLERFRKEECNAGDEVGISKDDNSIICAGSRSDNRDTCHGDSGGPLFVQHPKHRCMYLLLGVTSYGEFGCGATGQPRPAVYQRIAYYANWIKSIVWNERFENFTINRFDASMPII